MNAASNIAPDSHQSSVKYDDGRPRPTDFDNFIPWACNQLEVDEMVCITKALQEVYTAAGTKARRASVRRISKMKEPKSTESRESGFQFRESPEMNSQTVKIKINTTYDLVGALLQIKFTRNKRVPSKILKVIALVAPFYPRLTTINVDRGLDHQGLYEISKIVNSTHITEVILDNNFIPQANFHLLLEKTSCLNYLSLARCSINDAVLETLVPTLLTSTLSILNLSSNKITDEGAGYMANVLRYNRRLFYLNLAGNMITDIGAERMFSSLIEFALTPEEILKKREKFVTFWRQNILRPEIISLFAERKLDKKKPSVAKPAPPPTRKSKVIDPEELKNIFDGRRMMQPLLKPISDPFEPIHVFVKDGNLYCYGNNVLSYLNLAYNGLTYFSAKKLLQVLRYQKKLGRHPRGLVNVNNPP